MSSCSAKPGVHAGTSDKVPGRVLKFVAFTASSVTLLVAVAPSLIKPTARLVGAVHPSVAVSIDRAEVGWFRPKPQVRGVSVVEKAGGVTVFSAESLRADASLMSCLLHGGQNVNIFVDRPRVAAYDRLSCVTPTETPFSAECALDDRVHLFVSEGVLLVDEQAKRLLNGRLFIDVVKTGSEVRVASDSPSVSISGDFLRERKGVRFVRPLYVTAQMNQTFLTSFLGTINPLFARAVAVGTGRPVSMRVTLPDGVLPLDPKQSSSLQIDMDAYSLKLRQGPLIDDVLRILKLSNEKDVVVESSPARVLVSIHGSRQRVETVIDTVSFVLNGARRVDVGVSTTIEGSAADIASGNASLEMAIEIHPETLRDVMKIHTTNKGLRVQVRGSVSRPVVQVKEAVVRLGMLLVDGMLA